MGNIIFKKIIFGTVSIFDIFLAAVIITSAVIIAKIASINLRRYLHEKVEKAKLDIIIKVVYYSIIIIAVIGVLPLLGINLSGLLVAGGVTGIVIGFASQRIVSNLISGIFLMLERPVKIGQQINVEGTAGYVEDIRVLSTTIRTYDGIFVRIPNEKVFTSSITNYVAHVARRFEYTVGIRYQDDAEKAVNIIKSVVEEHPFVLKNPAPQIFVERLGESSVDILVKIWAPVSEWYGVKTELLWKIKKALEKEKIEIPFPQRVVWFANNPPK